RQRLRAISPAGVRSDAVVIDISVAASPDNHLAASPDSGVTVSASGCVGSAGGRPAILWVVFRPRVQWSVNSMPTPDDHFAARPNRVVGVSCLGHIIDAGSYPAVCAGIVFSTVVEDGYEGGIIIKSAPHDHFGSCPDGRVIPSSVRHVGSTRGHPTIGARFVSPAGDRIRRET